MRSYKRNFVKNALKKSTEKKVESRDGILWEFGSKSTCYVKIQGTNELITAHFPRNQLLRPDWLRKGNAVRINHRGGVRGYIEVSGPGRAIPQPTAGGSLPDTTTVNDGVIDGLVVTATDPVSDAVFISDGSYRINGIIYYYTGEESGYIVMEDPPPMAMGVIPISTMGISTFDMETAEAPPVGYFRYDIITINSSKYTTYTTGIAVKSNPQMPVIPANSVLVNFILRVGGDVGIPQNRIGIIWTPPYPVHALVSAPDEFGWSLSSDTPSVNISVAIQDQYGSSISAPSSTGWDVHLMKVYGTGDVYSSDSGYDETEVIQNITGSGYTFKYRRNQLASEKYPFFLVTVDASSKLYGVLDTLTLLGEDGEPLIAFS